MPYRNKKNLYEEYQRKINKTLNYIQENFSENIPLADLSKISGFSTFHFLRIFTALTGETPAAFIKRIKVEKAANHIINNPKLTITQIAFKCGYSSSQSFARDFKDYFGITPSQYSRKHNSNICNIKSNKGKALISTLAYDKVKGRNLINQKSNKNMEVKIQDFPAITVAYVRHIGQFKGNDDLFSGAFEKLCDWAYPHGLINNQTLFLAAYYDDPQITSEDKMRTDICLSIPDNIEPAGSINKEVFPAGKYAVARIEAKTTEDFEKGWNELYRVWLLKSGHEESNDRPCLEIYRNDPKKDRSGKYIVDICVPIK
jgi:AraC family transcriptional regulator